jgi:uncharacterized coiled-coil DUF342 family protein
MEENSKKLERVERENKCLNLQKDFATNDINFKRSSQHLIIEQLDQLRTERDEKISEVENLRSKIEEFREKNRELVGENAKFKEHGLEYDAQVQTLNDFYEKGLLEQQQRAKDHLATRVSEIENGKSALKDQNEKLLSELHELRENQLTTFNTNIISPMMDLQLQHFNFQEKSILETETRDNLSTELLALKEKLSHLQAEKDNLQQVNQERLEKLEEINNYLTSEGITRVDIETANLEVNQQIYRKDLELVNMNNLLTERASEVLFGHQEIKKMEVL